jgi:trans-2,3-dihydro-3-hydroxyanthranilate isomerase
VDVFATEPLMGNPLAVFPEGEGLSTAEMQAIAREMNLSETTFVTPPQAGGDVRVRIFTPSNELPFAGHPSVGTACTVVRLGMIGQPVPGASGTPPASAAPSRSGAPAPDTAGESDTAGELGTGGQPVTIVPVVLELGVGPTTVDVEVRGGEPLAGTVHQGPPHFGHNPPRDESAAVLSLAPADLHAELEPRLVGTGLDYCCIPLRDTNALARVAVDMQLLPAYEAAHGEVYPFAFTGLADPWVEARGLFPVESIPEDPATGSAAGPLAAYLADAGLLPIGETRVVLQGTQVKRPSRLAISVAGSRDAMTDVLVGGGVVPVISGELRL